MSQKNKLINLLRYNAISTGTKTTEPAPVIFKCFILFITWLAMHIKNVIFLLCRVFQIVFDTSWGM